jgi:hypothetical protein
MLRMGKLGSGERIGGMNPWLGRTDRTDDDNGSKLLRSDWSRSSLFFFFGLTSS